MSLGVAEVGKVKSSDPCGVGLLMHWSLCPQFRVSGLHLLELLFQNHNSSILDSALWAGMFKASGAILLTRRTYLASRHV